MVNAEAHGFPWISGILDSLELDPAKATMLTPNTASISLYSDRLEVIANF